ncbi:MAG TPA: hypothetical protein GX747_00535 [Tenericutes bacterium]|nr:hypothetical protein [Mycoplasmatota bacterium]
MDKNFLSHEQVIELLEKIETIENRIKEIRTEDASLRKQLDTLFNILDNSKVIPNGDVVTLGSQIKVKFDGEEEVETFSLVRTVDGVRNLGSVSSQSPMGKSIFNKKQGEKFSFVANEKVYTGTILEVINQAKNELENEKKR